MSAEFQAVGKDIQEVVQQHVFILDLSSNQVTPTWVRYHISFANFQYIPAIKCVLRDTFLWDKCSYSARAAMSMVHSTEEFDLEESYTTLSRGRNGVNSSHAVNYWADTQIKLTQSLHIRAQNVYNFTGSSLGFGSLLVSTFLVYCSPEKVDPQA